MDVFKKPLVSLMNANSKGKGRQKRKKKEEDAIEELDSLKTKLETGTIKHRATVTNILKWVSVLKPKEYEALKLSEVGVMVADILDYCIKQAVGTESFLTLISRGEEKKWPGFDYYLGLVGNRHFSAGFYGLLFPKRQLVLTQIVAYDQQLFTSQFFRTISSVMDDSAKERFFNDMALFLCHLIRFKGAQYVDLMPEIYQGNVSFLKGLCLYQHLVPDEMFLSAIQIIIQKHNSFLSRKKFLDFINGFWTTKLLERLLNQAPEFTVGLISQVLMGTGENESRFFVLNFFLSDTLSNGIKLFPVENVVILAGRLVKAKETDIASGFHSPNSILNSTTLKKLLSHSDKRALLRAILDRGKSLKLFEDVFNIILELMQKSSELVVAFDELIATDDLFYKVEMFLLICQSKKLLDKIAVNLPKTISGMISEGICTSFLHETLLSSYIISESISLQAVNILKFVRRNPVYAGVVLQELMLRPMRKSLEEEKATEINLSMENERLNGSKNQSLQQFSGTGSLLYCSASLGSKLTSNSRSSSEISGLVSHARLVNSICNETKSHQLLATLLVSHLNIKGISKGNQAPIPEYLSILPKKISFENDIKLYSLFNEHPVLFHYLDIISRDWKGFCKVFWIVTSLMATVIGRWYRGEKGLSPITNRLLGILKESKALPKPYCFCIELMDQDILSYSEVSSVLLNVWSFLNVYATPDENVNPSSPTSPLVNQQILFENPFISSIRFTMANNLPKTFHLFPFFVVN